MVMADRGSVDFGARMKRAREERGISLRQIATATKISVVALEALERNDISRLPGGIFSRAFVRSYAIEIGLDPEQTVREFLTQFPHDSVTAGSPHVPQEDHAAIESERRSAETAVKLIAISLPVAAAILYFTVWGAAPASNESAAAVPAAAVQAPAGAAAPLVFDVVATAPVTLSITIDGVADPPRTLAPGERLELRAAQELTLGMSDGGAVHLTIDSQPATPLGAAGEPRTVRIDRENYRTFLASP